MIKQECIGIPDMILLLMIFCFKKIKIKAEIVLSPGGAYFKKWTFHFGSFILQKTFKIGSLLKSGTFLRKKRRLDAFNDLFQDVFAKCLTKIDFFKKTD